MKSAYISSPTILIFFSVIIFDAFAKPLRAEYSIQLLGARNGGEFVFETGNRFPNLSGITGGSRISFERDYNLGGIGGKFFLENWEFSGQFTTTGWYTNTGRARDEDFFLFSVSQERAHHMNLRELSYYDSTNVYSGTRNFADGIGKSSMSEYTIDLFTRYYLGEAKADINSSGDGYFLSGGLKYTYNKYYFYDVNQWIATTPVYYQPIGYGLSFANSIIEVPVGFGYRWNWEKFFIDADFHLLFAYIQTRDFHKQRNINFESETVGTGILSGILVGYKFTEKLLGYIKLNQHRFFTKGSFTARGGITEDDIAANFLGRFKAHINTKEFNIQFGAELRPEWQ